MIDTDVAEDRLERLSRESDELLEKAAHATQSLRTAREDAKMVAAYTVHLMMERLREVLGEDTLKGLMAIAWADGGRTKLKAARVHVHGIDHIVSKDGRRALVITLDGYLAWVTATGDAYQVAKCDESELLAEDLEPIAQAVCDVLNRHLEKAERSGANFMRIQMLADKILDAIDA